MYQRLLLYCCLFSSFTPFLLQALHLGALCALLGSGRTQHSTSHCLHYFSPVLHICSPSGMRLSHSPIPRHHKLCACIVSSYILYPEGSCAAELWGFLSDWAWDQWMRIFPNQYFCSPRVSVIIQKCKCGTAQCSLCCSAVPAGIYSLVPASLQPLVCGLGDIKLSEEQRWPSTALTNTAAMVDKPLNQTFKHRLNGGQIKGVDRLRILLSLFCWGLAFQNLTPGCWTHRSLCHIAGSHPSSDRGFCSTLINSSGIPNPGSEGEGSAGCLLRTLSGHPWMGWGRREKWIFSTQWYTHQPV